MTPPSLSPPYARPPHSSDTPEPWELYFPPFEAEQEDEVRRDRAVVPAFDLQGAIAEGLRWLAGATLLRIGVEATLLQAPLWSLSGLVGLVLLLAPAAIGLYLSHHYPALRLVLAYRLMFIMLGLLLGGRL